MRLTVRMQDPRWEARDRYASGVVQEFHDYTGDLVPRFAWLDDNWFVLTTGDKDAPFRILHKDGIICGWLGSSDSSDTGHSTMVCIPRNGKSYTVSLCDDGSLACSCTSYGFRRRCSHIDEVMEAA